MWEEDIEAFLHELVKIEKKWRRISEQGSGRKLVLKKSVEEKQVLSDDDDDDSDYQIEKGLYS